MKSVLLLALLSVNKLETKTSRFRPLDDQGCFDEFEECNEHVARYHCVGSESGVEEIEDEGEVVTKAMEALAYCRESCKRKYDNVTKLPSIIEILGGVNEEITDAFGFRIPVCSLQNGFNSYYRMRLLETTMVTRSRPSSIPAFTKKGFKRVKLPKKIYEILLTHRKNALLNKQVREEVTASGAVNCVRFEEDEEEQECVESHQGTTFKMDVSDTCKTEISKILTPMAEKWAGLPLELTSVYGVRRYKRGAVLYTHLDKLSTHVISVIINIAQKVNEPWPLYIMDHAGKPHQVSLEPGEMLWYESAKLVHGRPLPFNGTYYDNIFVHFKPTSKKWYTEEDSLNGLGIPTRIITLEDLKEM